MYDRYYFLILFFMIVIFIIKIYKEFLFDGWLQMYQSSAYKFVINILIVFALLGMLSFITFIFYERLEVYFI